jgi:hypothetical protein
MSFRTRLLLVGHTTIELHMQFPEGESLLAQTSVQPLP